MRINKSDLVRYGFNKDCPQCEYTQKYGSARPGQTHTDECRRQLEEAMRATEDGRERLAAHEENLTRAMAEQVEHGAEAANQPRPPPIVKKGFLERGTAEPRLEPHAVPERPREPHPQDASIPPPRDKEQSQGGQPSGLPQSQPAGGAPTGQSSGLASEPVARAPAISEDFDRGDGVMEEGGDEQDVEMDFCGELNLMSDLGQLEPTFQDRVSELLLNQLGSVGKSYRKDARKAGKKIVSEIYSPPRVTDLIRKMRSRHVMPGFAFDITVVDPDDNMPWDFSLKEKRDKARQLIREQRPYLLIGSPKCTQFST